MIDIERFLLRAASCLSVVAGTLRHQTSEEDEMVFGILLGNSNDSHLTMIVLNA
jgi:hypothetical protein